MKYYFSGVGNWAKVQKPVDAYDTDKPQEYKIDVILDDKSWALFQESGCQLKQRKADSGEHYVTFRCPVTATWKGEEHQLKPTVLDSDNQPFDGLIGNGSNVTCLVDMFTTRMGMGHRLVSVRVDKLVEYAGNGTVRGEIESPF